MKRQRARIPSRGFSLLELMIVIAIMLILIGVAVPVLSHVMMNGRETGALGDLDAIRKAQAVYAGSRNGKCAASLQQLCGTAPGNSSGPAGLSGNVCSGEDSGYLFTLRATSDYTFTVDARPKSPGASGRRFFFLDEQGSIHENEKENGPASAASPYMGGDSHASK